MYSYSGIWTIERTLNYTFIHFYTKYHFELVSSGTIRIFFFVRESPFALLYTPHKSLSLYKRKAAVTPTVRGWVITHTKPRDSYGLSSSRFQESLKDYTFVWFFVRVTVFLKCKSFFFCCNLFPFGLISKSIKHQCFRSNLFCLVNCPPGTYGDNNTNTCVDCHIGFYQDDQGKPECQPCPKNYSTAFTGSKNSSNCRRK